MITVRSLRILSTTDPLFTNLPHGRFRLLKHGKETQIKDCHLKFCERHRDITVISINQPKVEPKKEVELNKCGECGKEFKTLVALKGHKTRSKHG